MKDSGKARMPARHWKVGCLVLALAPFACCIACCIFPFIPRGPYYQSPEMIGEREGVEADASQRIVREKSYTVTGPFPGPHGPFQDKEYTARY